MTAILSKREVTQFRSDIGTILSHDASVRTRARKGSLAEFADSKAREAYHSLQYAPDGIVIPGEVLFSIGQRALTVSNFSGGGSLVSDEAQAPFARNLFALPIFALGVQVLPNLLNDLRGDVSIPAVSSIGPGQFLAEGQAVSENALSLASRVAVPRRISACFSVSNQLLRQTDERAQDVLWALLARAIGSALEAAALSGKGGVEPQGLASIASVPVVALGVNGAAPTLAALNDVEASVIAANVASANGGYALSPNCRKKCKSVQKFTGSSTALLETGADGIDRLSGFKALATTALKDDYTKGSGSALGSLVFGAWDCLTICFWGGLGLVSNPYSRALHGETVITVTCYGDCVTPMPTAFCRVVDIVTS